MARSMAMPKKEWIIPLVWSMYGKLKVEAETLDEAVQIALDAETPLPEGDYLSESVEVDYAILYSENSMDPDLAEGV